MYHQNQMYGLRNNQSGITGRGFMLTIGKWTHFHSIVLGVIIGFVLCLYCYGLTISKPTIKRSLATIHAERAAKAQKVSK